MLLCLQAYFHYLGDRSKLRSHSFAVVGTPWKFVAVGRAWQVDHGFLFGVLLFGVLPNTNLQIGLCIKKLYNLPQNITKKRLINKTPSSKTPNRSPQVERRLGAEASGWLEV